MQKNENNLNSSNTTTESKELSQSKNLQILPQLEKDICVLINYIRTNPLDFSNNLIKNSKNKNLTEDQINLIKFLEEKYNKDPLLPFHEVPEISLAAKNLLNTISQNEAESANKGQKKLKASSLNLRTRLSNYGIRTGRIFSNVIFGIEKPEDIVNHILKGENGRNMLLSNKMKFIGIGCCLLPSNKVCAVIDIVQDFLPFKQSKRNNINIKYNINNINKKDINKEKEKENNIDPKMNFVINNTNNNEYIPNIINNNKHNNQRKKNLINENSNNNINVYKTPEVLTSMESSQQKSYKSYNIIINNNKIIPIRNNLNNINENKVKDENDNYFNLRDNKELKFEINSCNIGTNKSKSVYGFKLKCGNRGNSNINRYQKLNRKEKLEILHKINQEKNNNSMVKNNTNFENLIPLSPNYSKNKKKLNTENEYFSPIAPFYSRKIYNNNDSDSNNYEFNETMPNYISPNLDNDFKLSEIKNDLIMIKNQLKEELKLEVKNELKKEIKQEYKETKENAKKNQNRNNWKGNIVYHKRNKSDFFMKNKKENISVQKKEIKQNNYQSFDNNNNNKNNLYVKEEHRIKNKNEIKKLIRLYNKEKDLERSQYNNIKEADNLIYNNKIVKNKVSNLFFLNKSNNNSRINTNINSNIKGIKNIPDKRNLFLIKYQKVIPKDQTFKLTKNKTSYKKKISNLCLRKDSEKKNINPINNKQIKKENDKEEKNVYIINSYRNRSKQNKKMKEQSIELYLNDENFLKENKRYKTPKNNLKQNMNISDDIKLKYDAKNNINYKYKTLSFIRNKNYKI